MSNSKKCAICDEVNPTIHHEEDGEYSFYCSSCYEQEIINGVDNE